MNWYAYMNKMASAPQQLFHGTTAKDGQAIQVAGFLRSRGTAVGNWSSGLFGGNPSNPNLVYACTDRKTAIGYAEQICLKARTKNAALVTLLPDWKFAVPDEDVVFEIINSQAPVSSSLANKIWTAYAQQQEFESASEAYNFWHNPPEEMDEVSDSDLAGRMKDLAEKLPQILSSTEMISLTANMMTVAFSKPLQVVNVEYFKIA